MKGALHIGTVSGIRISIHWTFLILIGWIVFSNLKAGRSASEAGWSVLFILSLFVCVTLHELGHALMAKKFRIKTASITLLPIGGVAQMENIPEKPKEELLIALAGPAVNLVISLLLLLFISPAVALEQTENMQVVGPGNFWVALMIVNIWLAVFNLIPAFPMDGGRVFRALLAFRMNRTRATRIAAGLGQLLAIGFIFLGFYLNPFLIFIGLFIFLGAQAEAEQTQTQSLLKGFLVKDALLKEIPAIEAGESIRQAITHLLGSQNKYFLVNNAGRPEGTLSRDEIIRALQESGADSPVSKAMRQGILFLAPDMPIEEAWKKMRQEAHPFALVGSADHIAGAIDEENIVEFVMIRSAGEK